MANFDYIAKDAAGQQITGTMQAESEGAVLRALDDRKLYPVEVSQAAAGSRNMGGRVKLGDIGMMYGQLADLLRSGVPLLRSLDVLVKTATKKRLGEMIVKVRDDVSQGKTLAEALGNYPRTFTSLHAAMVRAGERGGFLEDVLANLSNFVERQDELRGKVLGALVYPLIVSGVGLVVVVGILIFLVPKFKPMFAGISLPLPTQMLFALSDILINHIILMLAMVLLAALGVRAFLRSGYGHSLWDRWRLKLPLAGYAMKMVAITRLCRILGTMLSNGVPILQAMTIAKDAVGSDVLEASIENAAQSVRAGDPLAGPLRESGLFPAQIVEMIAVAEESNQLDKVLVQVADTFERRTARQVDLAMRLIEPFMLVILAIIIGFTAVGLLYPIFTLSKAINR
jgi:general secretion pathway protein F/type IV pilus assembly protein PilC